MNDDTKIRFRVSSGRSLKGSGALCEFCLNNMFRQVEFKETAYGFIADVLCHSYDGILCAPLLLRSSMLFRQADVLFTLSDLLSNKSDRRF